MHCGFAAAAQKRSGRVNLDSGRLDDRKKGTANAKKWRRTITSATTGAVVYPRNRGDSDKRSSNRAVALFLYPLLCSSSLSVFSPRSSSLAETSSDGWNTCRDRWALQLRLCFKSRVQKGRDKGGEGVEWNRMKADGTQQRAREEEEERLELVVERRIIETNTSVPDST